MRAFLFLAPLIFFFISCTDDSGRNLQEHLPEIEDYFPSEVGNYWVYQHFEIDSFGNQKAMMKYDSLYVSGRTQLEGKEYFILKGNLAPYTGYETDNFLRDSSGYLVDHSGRILLSTVDFSGVLNKSVGVYEGDTMYTLQYKMEEQTSRIVVPAGEFDVINYKGTGSLYYYDDHVKFKTLPFILNTYYTKGVGKIMDTYRFHGSRDKYYERKLIRYNVFTPSL